VSLQHHVVRGVYEGESGMRFQMAGREECVGSKRGGGLVCLGKGKRKRKDN